MDYDKITEKVQLLINNAHEITKENNHSNITPLHIIKALLKDKESTFNYVLKKEKLNINAINKYIANEINKIRQDNGQVIHFDSFTVQLLNDAETIKSEYNDEFLSIEHIVLALFKNRDINVRNFISNFNLNEINFKKHIKDLRGEKKVNNKNPEETYQVLEKYGRELTEEVKNGKLDPIIGRDEEIRRVIQILSRKTKNNPVLIGEPGVGKTAIAEGLAWRIYKQDVPFSLKDKKVY